MQQLGRMHVVVKRKAHVEWRHAYQLSKHLAQWVCLLTAEWDTIPALQENRVPKNTPSDNSAPARFSALIYTPWFPGLETCQVVRQCKCIIWADFPACKQAKNPKTEQF